MNKFLILAFTFIAIGAVAQTKLDPANFETKMQELSNEQLVDVRTPLEFAKSHIDGAINIDVNGAKFEEHVSTLDKSKPVLVYCLSGARSAKAASYMSKQGFNVVYHLDGGMLKWNAAEKPVVSITANNGGLSKNEFDALTKKAALVLIDFHAKWCAPCLKMAPALDSIQASTTNFGLVKINVDDNSNLVREMKVSVLPRLLLFKNGKQVWSHTGIMDRKGIEEVINRYQ